MYCYSLIERLLLQGFKVTITLKWGDWHIIEDINVFYDHFGDLLDDSDIKKVEAEGVYGYMRVYL